jgi:phenol hydroxylase P0 protein
MPRPLQDRRYVRVTERDERWVEFEFSIGDPEIFVELVMAPAQFRQFCIDQSADQLPASSPALSLSSARGRREHPHGT